MTDAAHIFSTYEDRLIRRQKSDACLREYRIVTTRFMEWMKENGKEMKDIRRPDIEDFFAESGWSPRTQKARLTYLRQPWKYAVVEMELLGKSPFWGMPIELAKIPHREPKIITTETLRAIKAGIRDHAEAALFHTFAYTGFRLMEVRLLTWEDVSIGAGTVHTIGKGDRERTIPLHPAAAEALRGYGAYGQGSPYVFPGRDGLEMSHSGMSARVQRLWGAKYGVAAHDFRRTFATSLTNNGVERVMVAQLLGHAPDDMAGMHYVQFSPRLQREALLRIYRDEPL